MSGAYQSALGYVYGFTDYEKQSGFPYTPDRFDLKRVEQLMHLLGDPHRACKLVHVAGTKGKGSTSAILASVLMHSRYRTALYSSPHLHTFRERIQIDGELIAQDQVVAGIDRLRAVAAQVPGITTFELITALAFDHFAQHEVELAVIEVGLGGRLDATNVITPLVAVITSISYDHMMYLGNTLSEIAAEKAGIIKPGVPVVSAPQALEAQQVIERIAAERHSPLTLVARGWHWQSVNSTAHGQQFAAWPTSDPSRGALYSLPLLGRHQQQNAVTALATLDRLRQAGLVITEAAAHAGLRSVHWPGRLEVLNQRPWVIVDGAHNGDSMAKLRAAIGDLFPHHKLVLVLGVSADKDIDAMLEEILPIADDVLVSQAHHPRAASADSLADRVRACGRAAVAIPVDQALEQALQRVGEDGLVCATGSLFLVADFRAAWLKHMGHPAPPSDAE